MTRAGEIAERLADVRGRIASASARAGRDPAGITLVAVSKTKPLSDLLAAYEAGVREFGENRVQEAETKLPALPPDAVPHLIGPLQSNKVKRAVAIARVVQSVDSEDLARRLSRAAEQLGRSLEVFAEVNVAGEETKAGVLPERLPELLETLRGLPALSLGGLMAIPPPGETRPHFVRLRELAERHGVAGLSMGMSDDFEVAIEEGATVVRIGTALFGQR